jgi:hypothetical protein
MSTPAEHVQFNLFHRESNFGEEARVMVKRGEKWEVCGILSLRPNEWAAFAAATGFATFRQAPAPAPVPVPVPRNSAPCSPPKSGPQDREKRVAG